MTGTSTARPSDAISPEAWTTAHERLVADLRDLIRIPTVNPPGDEILAARHVASILAETGIPSTVVEPFPGRGSIAARLHGDGTGGGPLLLLGHLDVVPAPAELWTHDPFAADIADGYVYGRGAVDMKNLVAMELGVMRLLAGEARAAGRDPATDPIPGLRRDILFASTADEEAGGRNGAGWVVDNHPEWLQADAAINESRGRLDRARQACASTRSASRRRASSTTGSPSTGRGATGRCRGTTTPRSGPPASSIGIADPGPPRLTPVMDRFFDGRQDGGAVDGPRDRRPDRP